MTMEIQLKEGLRKAKSRENIQTGLNPLRGSAKELFLMDVPFTLIIITFTKLNALWDVHWQMWWCTATLLSCIFCSIKMLTLAHLQQDMQSVSYTDAVTLTCPVQWPYPHTGSRSNDSSAQCLKSSLWLHSWIYGQELCSRIKTRWLDHNSLASMIWSLYNLL